MPLIYCLKCKSRKEVADEACTTSKMANGRNMISNVCPDCNRKINRFAANTSSAEEEE